MVNALDDIRLADPEFWRRADVHAAFAALRHERPISWQEETGSSWRTGGGGSWAVVRHADVKFVSSTPGVFSSRYGVGVAVDPEATGGMLVMDDPEHRELRRVVSARFTPKQVIGLRENIERRVDETLSRSLDAGESDFVSEVSESLPTAVVLDMLGCPDDLRAEMLTLTKEVFSPDPDASKAAENVIAAIGERLGAGRRGSDADDLFTVIANGRANGRPLSDEDVGKYYALLVTAGIETTGTVMAHSMVALQEFPEERRLWRDDFEGTRATALEELVRWTTPVRKFCRTALEECEVAGQQVSAGEKVTLWYMSANRDEQVFDRPDVLNLRRHPNPHLAFGGFGPHFCLGSHLAKLELTIFFRQLFDRVLTFELGEPVYALNDGVNAIESLPCRMVAR